MSREWQVNVPLSVRWSKTDLASRLDAVESEFGIDTIPLPLVRSGAVAPAVHAVESAR